MAHLLPGARELLESSNETRIHVIREGRWIEYPRATAILAEMNKLINYPRKPRMPNVLLVGESNSGKTTIARHFFNLNPFQEREEGIEAPVVFIEAPSEADEKRIYAYIVETLYGPMRRWARIDQLEYQAHRLLHNVKARVLVIDEFQHLITGPTSKQNACRQALKSLSNRIPISIIAVGLPEAHNAVNQDPQLASRFQRMTLERWTNPKEVLVLLRTIGKMLPLSKPSFLTDHALASEILDRSEGLLGEICDLLARSAEHAITSGRECIDLQVLSSCGFVRPSERRENFPRKSR